MVATLNPLTNQGGRPRETTDIPADELERFRRMKRTHDIESIADFFWLNRNLVTHAFTYGRCSEDVLTALREFYHRQTR